MENRGAIVEASKSFAFPMENPFSFKFCQVFTGFGVGCGIGIGVGQPMYLGAIPMVQQVMSAARGATDALSGVGQHVNGSLRKVGMKNVQAGVGCGVGIGHGFGVVGIALKPGVVHRIQSSVALAVTKLMLNMGLAPSISSMQSVVPGSVQSSINALTNKSAGNVQSSISSVVGLTSKSSESSSYLSRSSESVHRDTINNQYELKGISDRPHSTHTEKVIDSFMQSPIFNQEENTELNELAENLRAENNVLQVLLKQQRTIQGLMEENQRFQRILVEDLKISPSKLHTGSESFIKSNYPCSDCFECRRRKRKTEK